MEDPDWGIPEYALVQFIQYWNWRPDEREEMLDGEPVCDAELKASIGAVVHALCVKCDIEPPRWAVDAKAAEPRLLFRQIPLDSVYGRCLMEQSPAVCEGHGVYFEADLLEKGNHEWFDNKMIEVAKGLGRPVPQA